MVQAVFALDPAVPVTEAQLCALGPDVNAEVVDGKLVIMSPAGRRHGELSARVNFYLYRHVQENGLGKVYADQTTYVLAENVESIKQQRVPDVSFVQQGRLSDEQEPDAFWYGPPDLAVEIISPTETANQIRDKVNDYLSAGTGEVWVVYPQPREVVVYRAAAPKQPVILSGDDVLTSETLLPGFALALPDLFA